MRRCLGWFRRATDARDEVLEVAQLRVTLVIHDNGDRMMRVRNSGRETAIGVSVGLVDPAVTHDPLTAPRTVPTLPVGDLGADEDWTMPLAVGFEDSRPDLFHLQWIDGAGFHSERFAVPSVEFCDDYSPGGDDTD